MAPHCPSRGRVHPETPKFLHEQNESDCVVEDMCDPVRAERDKGQGITEISQDTKAGSNNGDRQHALSNACPVTAVVYSLHPLRDPDPANLAPLRDGLDLTCVVQSG